MCNRLWLLLALWVALPAWSQARLTPEPDAVVLPQSLYGQDATGRAIRALEKAWRTNPQQSVNAWPYARAAFTQGLSTGDMRWLGNAKAALMPWWNAQSMEPEGFYLRGLIKQGFHHFDEGLNDINQAIARSPDQAEYWSWRFVLHVLLSRFSQAQSDLQHMQRWLGAEETAIYRAILDYRTGHADRAIAPLRRAMSLPRFQDGFAQEWVGFHLGEALRLSGQTEAALAIWQQQLVAQPESHWLRLSLVTELNHQSLHQKARALAIRDKPIEQLSDALLAQVLIAEQGMQSARAIKVQSMMAARIEAQEQRQDGLIERPTLVYYIDARGDVSKGLELAVRNWLTQQDPPDALLLLKAAWFSNRPRMAQPVFQWLKQSGYRDPLLNHWVNRLQAHPAWSQAS